MTGGPSHFELIHSGPRTFYVRFIAGNGEEVWRTSETYTTRRAAREAIDVLVLLAAPSRDRVKEVDARG